MNPPRTAKTTTSLTQDYIREAEAAMQDRDAGSAQVLALLAIAAGLDRLGGTLDEVDGALASIAANTAGGAR